jgi:ATP adenylyltransferase
MRDRELGMSFIVSFAESSSASMASSSSAASAAASDPFAPENREGSLIVVGEGAFPSPGAGYSVLLNKFGTMHDHVLLVTESFEPQGAGPLTESDIAALYALVTRLPGVGFYNSGEAAGASQPHKHMQAVPLDVLAGYLFADKEADGSDSWDAVPFAPPIDELFSKYAETNGGATAGVRSLPELPFAHAFAALPNAIEAVKEPAGGDESIDSGTLWITYQALLDHAGLSELGEGRGMAPYNLVLTEEWMLVVPRSQRMYGNIDVNGFGFMGCLLVRGDAGRQTLRSTTPAKILEGVGFSTSRQIKGR